MEEERLDLISLCVAEGDRGTFGAGRGLAEERIARGAGGVFRMRDIVRSTGGSEFITPGGRHRSDEVAVGVAIWAPAVIEMRDGEMQGKGRDDLAQDGKERQRVGAARHGDDNTLSCFEDMVQRDRESDASGKHQREWRR